MMWLQEHMSFSQLLTEPDSDAGSAASQAAPAAADAPASHASFTATDQSLPPLSSSLDDVELDVDALDDIMWDDLDDLGFSPAATPDL